MDKESRLLTEDEIKHAVKEARVSQPIGVGTKAIDAIRYINKAQDTKSVKARDKEWVEWLAKYTEGDLYGDANTPDYMLFQIPDKEIPQTLKRSIDEK